MPDDLILFHIQGPDGDETARELFDLLRAEFGVRPERMDRERRWRKDPAGAGEPVPVTALIYSIPAETLAVSDPEDRSRSGERWEKVIAWAKEKRTRMPEEQIEVELPGGGLQPLDEPDVEAMLGGGGRMG